MSILQDILGGNASEGYVEEAITPQQTHLIPKEKLLDIGKSFGANNSAELTLKLIPYIDKKYLVIEKRVIIPVVDNNTAKSTVKQVISAETYGKKCLLVDFLNNNPRLMRKAKIKIMRYGYINVYVVKDRNMIANDNTFKIWRLSQSLLIKFAKIAKDIEEAITDPVDTINPFKIENIKDCIILKATKKSNFWDFTGTAVGRISEKIGKNVYKVTEDDKKLGSESSIMNLEEKVSNPEMFDEEEHEENVNELIEMLLESHPTIPVIRK